MVAGVMRLPAEFAHFPVAHLLVSPAALALQVARALRWQGAMESVGEMLIDIALGQWLRIR